MRVLVAVILVWALLFAIPFAVYGSASTFLDLKAPVGPAWRFLCGVAVTKLGTTAAFVALFALSRDAWRGHWPLYGSIWFAMFAASDPHSGSVMAKAAIASPLATLGSHSRFCSTVPNRLIAPDPRPCMAKAKSASP